MKIDRYTKVLLTIIALGIIGLNIHFFSDDFFKEAQANENAHSHDTRDVRFLTTYIQAIVQGECVINEKISNELEYYIRCFQGPLSN